MNKKESLVLMLSISDYANVGFFFSESLKSVGVNAYIFQEKRLTYMIDGYCAPLLKSIRGKLLLELVNNADIILWIQTPRQKKVRNCFAFDIFRNAMNDSRKRTAIFHGGSIYRRSSTKTNKLYNKVDVSLIQTAEMLGRGAKNEVWMLPTAVIHSDIKPKISIGKNIIVGHFPSAKDNILKGTYLINNIIKQYKKKVEYVFSPKRVNWIQSLKRMNKCDIYIESLSCASDTKDKRSKNKHDWSVTALEAAMLGKIVITNFYFGYERYKKEYGKCGLFVANTPKELKDTLDQLLSMSSKELINIKKKTREWAINTHGPIPTGKRLRKVLDV